jgi:hypothetical protein
MAMASFPWQPQCAIGIGEGHSEILSTTYLDLRANFPLFLSYEVVPVLKHYAMKTYGGACIGPSLLDLSTS